MPISVINDYKYSIWGEFPLAAMTPNSSRVRPSTLYRHSLDGYAYVKRVHMWGGWYGTETTRSKHEIFFKSSVFIGSSIAIAERESYSESIRLSRLISVGNELVNIDQCRGAAVVNHCACLYVCMCVFCVCFYMDSLISETASFSIMSSQSIFQKMPSKVHF